MINSKKPRINLKKKSIVRLSSDEMRLIAGATPQRRDMYETTMMTTAIHFSAK